MHYDYVRRLYGENYASKSEATSWRLKLLDQIVRKMSTFLKIYVKVVPISRENHTEIMAWMKNTYIVYSYKPNWRLGGGR